MLALLIILALDLHHVLLRGVIESYHIFVPGQPLLVGDISQMITRVVSKAFLLGFQLASPFVAVALIFNLGLGLLSRLMPQMQVFFRSEEHTSELQSLMRISYAVFCLKKKKNTNSYTIINIRIHTPISSSLDN